MLPTAGTWGEAALATLVVVPGVAAAQALDPSVVGDVGTVGRAAGSFVAVGAVGAGFLARYSDVVDAAVEDTLARPGAAVAYGLFAYVVVAFLGLFVTNLLIQAGVSSTPLAYLVPAVPAVGVVVLGGLGFAVVGTLLTEVGGPRRRRLGVLFGATISAVGWLVLPLVPAFFAWVLVAAFGVGGMTRTWIHSERTVRTEVNA